MKRRIILRIMIVMVFAFTVAAIPETTLAAEPTVAQLEYHGKAAHARWSSCPDWNAIEPGEVCTDTSIVVGESRANGKLHQQSGTKRPTPFIYFGQFEYTIDDQGYYEHLGSTFGSTNALSHDFDQLLAGASVEAMVPVGECSYHGEDRDCIYYEIAVRGTWTGVGEREHYTDTYRWESVWGSATYHHTGWIRDATVELDINGNPVKGINQDAALLDSKSGSIYIAHE